MSNSNLGDEILIIDRSLVLIQIYAIMHFLLTEVFAFVFLSTADAPAELNSSLPHPRTWEERHHDNLTLKYFPFGHFQEFFLSQNGKLSTSIFQYDHSLPCSHSDDMCPQGQADTTHLCKMMVCTES